MDGKRKGCILVLASLVLLAASSYEAWKFFKSDDWALIWGVGRSSIMIFIIMILILAVVILTGLCYFHLKPFFLKPGESEDEISPEDSWKSFVISTRDNRFKQLINMDIYVLTGLIGLIVFCTTLLPDAAKLKMPIVLAGVIIFSFLFFTHWWASWAYTREVKKCPSARFSREEGVWLLEVTDEILHRLIQADAIGLFVLLALMGLLFSLRY